MRTSATCISRAGPRAVALETTLLVHGVPRDRAPELAAELGAAVRAGGAEPSIVGIISGVPIVGLTGDELRTILETPAVEKVNTANLGVVMHGRRHGATTVSATVELAANAGVRIFATGGIGGVHRGYGQHLDISSDLLAIARFPVAVVASGVKSLLDVESTREALETLGVPVVGFRTDRFPAFYLRESGAGVDARFDDPAELGSFVAAELSRTGRGIVVANPIPESAAVDPGALSRWVDESAAGAIAAGAAGREVTPAVLADLHRRSGGATLRANVALAIENARLAGRLACQLRPV